MLKLCRKVADEVQKAVKSVVGTKKAGKFCGIGADGTPTEGVDVAAEAAALRVLEKAGISMLVVSEEAGKVEIGESPEYICILDPVDGSYNAVRGIPIYSLSIAFAEYSRTATLNEVEYALVKNLATGNVFETMKGKKPRCNGKKISTRSKDELGKCTFSIYAKKSGFDRMLPLLKTVEKTRTLGSVALELCYVARGDLDGVADLRNDLRNIDIAAGKLILEEAGGVVSDENGNTLKAGITGIEKVNILAAGNKGIHRKVLKAVGAQ